MNAAAPGPVWTPLNPQSNIDSSLISGAIVPVLGGGVSRSRVDSKRGGRDVTKALAERLMPYVRHPIVKLGKELQV